MKSKNLILFLLGLAIVVLFLNQRYSNTAPALPPAEASVDSEKSPSTRLRVTRSPICLPLDESPDTNRLERLLQGEGDEIVLTAEQVELYLAKNRRNAESLLTAFRASGDKKYLDEAKEKFPNDSRVNCAGLLDSLRRDDPEEHRRWLDDFKKSDPNNAMADYLSAGSHFKSGDTERALEDLSAASGKTAWNDYSLDTIQSSEEAYRTAGYSDAEASAIAMQSILAPHLASLKGVGLNLIDLAKSYRHAGDEASAQAALSMAVELGRQMDKDNPILIDNLVAIAIENMALKNLEPTAPYANTGQTVQERIDQLKQRKTDIKDSLQPLQAAMATMSERDIVDYFNRLKIFGEEATARWAINKFGPKQ